MPKKWMPHQAKKFCRELKLGKPYYVVFNMATNLAPYEDSQTYSEYVFTSRLPFTNNPCTDDGGSAATICQNFGPVYDAPPRGLRNIADPPRQVGAPLGTNDYWAPLDDDELYGLEKHVKSGSDPATRQRLGGRRRR